MSADKPEISCRLHGNSQRGAISVPSGRKSETGKFGRLFPHLEPLQADYEALRALSATMFESISPSADNPGIPAAYTYFAQFVDHDLTFDTTTLAEARVDPASVRNFRTPAFDLDSVYGAGPVVQPWLYHRDDPDLLQTGCTTYWKTVREDCRCRPAESVEGYQPQVGKQADLPRSFAGFALIADPRNDENLLLAQLHLAFLHFHNSVVHWLCDNPSRRVTNNLFQDARSLTTLHYQWVVLNDLLPRIAGAAWPGSGKIVSRLGGFGQAFLPLEFSAAAFRFGHSMVRPLYNVNGRETGATLKHLFENTGSRRGPGAPEPKAPINERWVVDWMGLIGNRPGINNVLSRRIDPFITDELGNIHSPKGPVSLPERNLIRGNSLGLPSGQAIARLLGVRVLSPEELSTGDDGKALEKHGMTLETPLWYYVLKEAHRLCDGLHLGPVGGAIVADVFIGLLALDPNSVLNCSPNWTPSLPSMTPCDFRLEDLLRFAGVLAEGEDRDATKAPSLGLSAKRKVLPEAYVS